MDHRNREKLLDVREQRRVAEPFEFRQESGSGKYILTGYAATWEPYDCYGGPSSGGWVETLSRAAFQQTLSQNPDVMLLINHEGLPLARTKSGTLSLSTDNHGLLMRAQLDPDDPDVQRLAPKMKPQANGQSNLDEMSFSFRVKTHRWDANHTNREITELSLQKGDVSVVNYGMNPKTHAVLSTEAVGALASLSNQDLMEVRGMDRTTLGRAMLTLERAWRSGPAEAERGDFGGKKAAPFKKGGDKQDDDEDDRATSSAPGGKLGGGKNDDDSDERAGTWVNSDGSHLLYDGVCITCQNDRAKAPYGAVPYADPGYLGPDRKPAHDGNGVKRYPIDESHVKAAWSYINMPKNQSGYTAEQLSAIKGRIKAAMKKHGHDVSEDKKALRADDDCTCPDGNCPEHDRQDEGEEMGYRVEAVRAANGGISMVAVTADGSRTPLPSFRQSGQLHGSPRGTGVYGSRATAPSPDQGTAHTGPPINDSLDNSMGVPRTTGEGSPNQGGPPLDYDWKPGNVTDDPHDAPYTKSDEGAKDPGELHGRSQSDDEDDEGEVADDIDDKRSVTERLRELRNTAELPDLPTLNEAFDHIRSCAS